MLIKNPIQYLKDLTETAEKLGYDSVQYLGNEKWLRVSAKPFGPPLTIEHKLENGQATIVLPISRAHAIQRLAEVE